VNDSIAQDEGWTSYDMSAAVDYENAMRAVRQPGPVRRGALNTQLPIDGDPTSQATSYRARRIDLGHASNQAALLNVPLEASRRRNARLFSQRLVVCDDEAVSRTQLFRWVCR